MGHSEQNIKQCGPWFLSISNIYILYFNEILLVAQIHKTDESDILLTEILPYNIYL